MSHQISRIAHDRIGVFGLAAISLVLIGPLIASDQVMAKSSTISETHTKK